MFDEDSFAQAAFDDRSWSFDVVERTVRFIVRLVSRVTTAVTLMSRL